MNHPCKDWYDTKKRELKKDKQTDSILDNLSSFLFNYKFSKMYNLYSK